jgi:predicted nucleic acid-binding protein
VSDCRLPLDTGVLITLAAATGGWDILDSLGRAFVVTFVVMGELRRGATGGPGVDTPLPASMGIWPERIVIPPWLENVLDPGEASTIALALEQGWPEVAIDEAVGRSIARNCRLRLTGSLGLLIRAKRKGYAITLANAVARIRAAGIWLGEDVAKAALRTAGENADC